MIANNEPAVPTLKQVKQFLEIIYFFATVRMNASSKIVHQYGDFEFATKKTRTDEVRIRWINKEFRDFFGLDVLVHLNPDARAAEPKRVGLADGLEQHVVAMEQVLSSYRNLPYISATTRLARDTKRLTVSGFR
ncbi:MAG: hypothetical protein U0936_11100 [Planctomycetaceae bacterium]